MMQKFKIAVTADERDADYTAMVSEISEEDLNEIKPLIEAIKNFKQYKAQGYTFPSNYPRSEYRPDTRLGEKTIQEIYPDIDEDAFETFFEYCPCGMHGIRHINSVEIWPLPIDGYEKLL